MENNLKLLLISYHFAPSIAVGAKRFSHLSYFFTEINGKVVVLTIDDNIIEKKDQSLKSGGDINRVKMFPPFPIKRNNVIKKIFSRLWENIAFIDPYSGFVIPGIIRGLKLCKMVKFDYIIVSGPPFSSFLLAYLLSKYTRVKLCLDYRDPWFEYQGNSSKLNKKLNDFLERKILIHSNKIIFNTNFARSAYLKNFNGLNLENKSYVVSNAFFKIFNQQPLLLDADKKNILYAGNFYGERNLSYLIDPLIKLFKQKLIYKDRIKIHVFGKILNEDYELFKKQNLSDLIVEHSFESYDNILRYMNGADILYLPQGNDVKYSLAYKFYDYLSVKKPILAITSLNSATSEIMQKIQCGECAEIYNEESVYTSLRNILLNEKEYNFAGIENYTWEKISSRFLEILLNKGNKVA